MCQSNLMGGDFQSPVTLFGIVLAINLGILDEINDHILAISKNYKNFCIKSKTNYDVKSDFVSGFGICQKESQWQSSQHLVTSKSDTRKPL